MKIKSKTKKAASKRFKIKKSGKIFREAVGKRHLLQNKSKKSKRHKRQDSEVSSANIRAIKTMISCL